jgi:hypothetical protein
VVFAAFAGGGTGSAAVGDAARGRALLASSGPLDVVRRPGDTFAPAGVASTGDPQWQSKFEELFDAERLAVPFYPAPGAADHRGDLRAQVDYGVFNARWKMPDHSYSFAVQGRGERLVLVALDTPSLLGPLGVARTRHASRVVNDALHAAPPGFKIAFGHHRVFRGGTPAIRERGIDAWLTDLGVDVYIAGEGPEMAIEPDASGVVQVVAGARDRSEAGFAWFRLAGRELQISLRAADGRVLARHALAAPRSRSERRPHQQQPPPERR